MALVIRKIISLHFYFNDECSDPRVRDWPLMSDPTAIWCILAGYLYFVFKLGPQLMRHRDPFKLENVIRCYDLIQIVFCGWLVVEAIRLGYFFGEYNILCQAVDYSNSKLSLQTAWRAWFYFVIKVIDLLDTVFFVLRKKQSQISFLHVYHHTGEFIKVFETQKLARGYILIST